MALMFNEQALIRNKAAAELQIQESEVFGFIYQDLINRLQIIDKDFAATLVISTGDKVFWHRLVACQVSSNIDWSIFNQIPKGAKQYDLICFPFGLHWIADVPDFFRQVKFLLKPDGIFIGNFPAGGSLSKLRKAIFTAEDNASNRHFPHILPFIRFDDITLLFQQAGFMDNVTDLQLLELEYKSPLALMKAIKALGEANIMNHRSNYALSKAAYRYLDGLVIGNFQDQLNVAGFTVSPTKNAIKLKGWSR